MQMLKCLKFFESLKPDYSNTCYLPLLYNSCYYHHISKIWIYPDKIESVAFFLNRNLKGNSWFSGDRCLSLSLVIAKVVNY